MTEISYWVSGIFVAVIVGHYVTAGALWTLRRFYCLDTNTEGEAERRYVAVPMGLIERATFTTLVAFSLMDENRAINFGSALAAMGAWMALKLAVGWRRREGANSIAVRNIIRESQAALLASLISLSMATLGGFIAVGRLF